MAKINRPQASVATSNNLHNSVRDKFNQMSQKESSEWQMVSLDDIVANEKNMYEMENLESLEDSIDDYGLLHNIVVQEMPDGKKKLISGERRYRAALMSREDGKRSFSKGIMARVVPADKDPIDVEIMLIQANKEVRNRSQAVKLREIVRLKELYEEKKKQGEQIKGSISERIAQEFDITQRQVQKVLAINKKGTPELKQAVEDELITLEDAAKYAQLSDDSQGQLMNILYESEDGVITQNDYLKLKEKEKSLRNDMAVLQNNLQIERVKNQQLQIRLSTQEQMHEQRQQPSIDIFADDRKPIFEEKKPELPKKTHPVTRSVSRSIQRIYKELKIIQDQNSDITQVNRTDLQNIIDLCNGLLK